jgi:enoyl-CoA hydratase/carnithine racemase
MSRCRLTVTDGIAEIVLARPPVNALDVAYLDEVITALRTAGRDPAVRSVIVASDLPKVFCAGIDLSRVLDPDPLAVHHLLEKLYLEIADVQYGLGKPSIAAVTGAARGGGMTLSISCNVIVAGRSATFGYPEVDVGVIPAIHFIHLPKIIGRHRAFELLFTGRTFDAAEAQGMGLVSRVVEDSDVRAEARRLARVFASKPAAAMALGHRGFMRHNDYRVELGHVTEAFCTVAATTDAKDAVRAFFDRSRKPAKDSQS